MLVPLVVPLQFLGIWICGCQGWISWLDWLLGSCVVIHKKERLAGGFQGLGCSLGRAGPTVWRVLIAASCVLKPPRLWSLLQLAFSGWPVYFFSAQFALLGVIADSEYVDSMGTVGR